MNENSYCSTSSLAFSIVSILDFGRSNRCAVVCHYFNLHSPDDAWCGTSIHILGGPKSLFVLFHKLLQNPGWTFWPSQYLFAICISFLMGFPGSSAGKESACNTGDPSLIPRLGRSFGEGMDYPLQYPWASLVASMVKNPPAMWETWVWSLGWEGHLEEGMATHSSILAWRISKDRGAWGVQSMGLQRVGHNWVTKHSTASSLMTSLLNLGLFSYCWVLSVLHIFCIVVYY